MNTAVITGVTGQDGAYLTKFLLNKGYKVYGAVRRISSQNLWRLKYLGVHEHPNFELVDFDLTDPFSAQRLISVSKPSEVYNLAAQSFVGVSFNEPHATAQITGLGVLNLLEAIKNTDRSIKFYQASTSEMFGKVQEIPQTEKTSFYPRSPYGVAKLYAHWLTINYRESYDIFAASGILFNHESPIRGLEFVTRKITHSVANIAKGRQKFLELGNLDAKRDWGYAGDYVEGMWRMLQAGHPDTYVLATNLTVTVREFVKWAFEEVNIPIIFSGEGVDEVGRNANTGEVLVKVNPEFFRPAEVDLLIGNPKKAKEELGWQPKVKVRELCKMMVEADLKRVELGKDAF
jgi:GDPmannose 4,6-dehydratase